MSQLLNLFISPLLLEKKKTMFAFEIAVPLLFNISLLLSIIQFTLSCSFFGFYWRSFASAFSHFFFLFLSRNRSFKCCHLLTIYRIINFSFELWTPSRSVLLLCISFGFIFSFVCLNIYHTSFSTRLNYIHIYILFFFSAMVEKRSILFLLQVFPCVCV